MSFSELLDILENKKKYLSNEEFLTVKAIITKAMAQEQREIKENDSAKVENVSVDLEAEKYKEEGNSYFKQGQYDEAIFSYTEAIKIDPKNKVYYSNRAAAYAMMNMDENGIDDCLNALKIDKSYVKAHIRLGDFYSKKDVSKAIESYDNALVIDPENETVKKKKECLNNEKDEFDIKKMMDNPEIAEMIKKLNVNKNGENGKDGLDMEAVMKELMKFKK